MQGNQARQTQYVVLSRECADLHEEMVALFSACPDIEVVVDRCRERMKCQICGKKTASIKKVTKSFGRGPSLVVIEDIPVLSCTGCHESYITVDTAREIDRIRKNRLALGKAKRVLVASFRQSAA